MASSYAGENHVVLFIDKDRSLAYHVKAFGKDMWVPSFLIHIL